MAGVKKFWWGIFFGGMIGIFLLRPDSKISYMMRDMFYNLQDGVVFVLDRVTDDPAFAVFVFVFGATLISLLTSLASSRSPISINISIDVCGGIGFLALNYAACDHIE